MFFLASRNIQKFLFSEPFTSNIAGNWANNGAWSFARRCSHPSGDRGLVIDLEGRMPLSHEPKVITLDTSRIVMSAKKHHDQQTKLSGFDLSAIPKGNPERI